MDTEDNEKICEYSFYADDFEMDFDSHEIVDTGRVKSAGKTFHSTFIRDFADFLDGTEYICRHKLLYL